MNFLLHIYTNKLLYHELLLALVCGAELGFVARVPAHFAFVLCRVQVREVGKIKGNYSDFLFLVPNLPFLECENCHSENTV